MSRRRETPERQAPSSPPTSPAPALLEPRTAVAEGLPAAVCAVARIGVVEDVAQDRVTRRRPSSRDDSHARGSVDPGGSNTRVKKQADASGVGAEPEAARPQRPKGDRIVNGGSRARVVNRRVDTLYLAFQGSLRCDVRGRLMERTRAGHEARAAADFDLPTTGARFEVSRMSREGHWRLISDQIRVIIDEGDHLRGWGLEMQPSAELLATEGPATVLAYARAVAEELCGVVTGARVRRLDLCADVAGLDVRELDPGAFVGPPRSRTERISVGEFREFFRADRRTCYRRTGFAIGRGTVRARIYDKLEELALSRNDSKRDAEHARFAEGGWDAGEALTRVEVEFHGEALHELAEGLRDDPELLLERVANVWAYFTTKWLRIVERNAATRATNCPTTETWEAVQRAFGPRLVRATRKRRPSFGCALDVVRRAISHQAAVVQSATPIALSLDDVGHDGEERGWTTDRCQMFVRSVVGRAMSTAERDGIADILQRYGDRGAVHYVVESYNAKLAKHADSFATWSERQAIADERRLDRVSRAA